jgi:surface antigen
VAAIQAQLPEVLETQLSGTTVAFNDPLQGVSGTLKPLTTFVNADGKYCRAFEAHASGDGTPLTSRGVACRDKDGRWVTRVQVNAV